MTLPGGWTLRADDECRPFLQHGDGRSLEPKVFAEERDAREVYTALKLEEDRLGRLYRGVENDPNWIVIWRARVVIGVIFADKVSPERGDALFHKETEDVVRRMQHDRAIEWGG